MWSRPRHPLAAQAGLRILARGGNAVDAAIAAAATLIIVEPVSNGLGSDAFAILWDGKELTGLNASGTAPAAWNPDYSAANTARMRRALPSSRCAAGTVSPCRAPSLAGKCCTGASGACRFADLLQPAIEIAERGHAVATIVQHKWAAAVPDMKDQPGFAAAFMPHGRAPQVAEKFVFKEAANTLRILAAQGPRAYYEGEIAARIAAFSQECGGAMTKADLAAYRAEWVKPISKSYRGYDVHEIPPNGQGIAALIALGILKNFDLAGMKVDGVDSQHVQIEAMKLAFADIYRYVADPRAMTVTPEEMLERRLPGRARQADQNGQGAASRLRHAESWRHHLPRPPPMNPA